MPNTVPVTCPCGVVFERLVQRGRPPIWCPKCRLLPVVDRAERPEVIEDEGPDRDDENDRFNRIQRAEIEAKVAKAYEQWPVVWENRSSDDEANLWLRNQMLVAYGKQPMMEAVEDDD